MAVSKESWIVMIVAVVAVIGLLTMFTGGTLGDNDISGQAIAAKGMINTTANKSTAGPITTASNKCTDSDGGLDEYTKGTTKGEWLSSSTKEVKSHTDSCYDTATVKEYYCVTDKSKLSLYGQEDSGAVNQEFIDCARGEICNSAICAAAVDFEVSDASMTVDTSDGAVDFYTRVKNSGSLDATLDDLYVEIEWQNDDGTGGSIGAPFTVTQTIKAGATESIAIETSIDSKWIDDVIAGSTSKTITAAITLDYSETVVETDETNNQKTRTLSILGVGAEQIALS
ncbi:hypothetical protein HZC31_05245 [Candidatus Woesearchaeota archaeon]|nr:hypothetical protein [Candidatus Woesearchaeota archaeon]